MRAEVERQIRTEKGWADDRELTDVETDWFFDETFERLYEMEEYVELDAEMEVPLEWIRRFQPETETHGFVWVCLRKGDGVQTSKP